jgi:adhesin/invasin
MSSPRYSLLPPLFAALILALSACDENTPSTPPSGAAPSSLRVVGGDGQHGEAGSALPEEVTVAVLDASGKGIPGFPVRFFVVSGGGQVATQTVTSDDRGLARAAWTLGTVAADSQVIEARLEGAPAVRLRAHARPAAPAALAMAAGNGAAGPVGAALADSLAVTVKDRYGNPVVGLEVAWEARTGGGTLSPARTVTGANGMAKAAWTLGPRVDSAQVALARVAGLDSVVFVANAVTAGAPLQLAKRGGDGQRGAAGTVLADSLGVSLRMQDGRPVAGALVTWNVPPQGGTVAPLVTRTDANGAASAVWRLGTAPGLVQATATVDDGTLVFTSLVEADAPTGIAAVAGGGAGSVGGALADSLAVRVTDRYGNPVPGVEVEWSAQSGGGSVQPTRSAADSLGIARARWTLGPSVGVTQTAQARIAGLPPVAFSATATTAGVPLQLAKRGGDGQRAPVESMLADSLGVVLRMADGRPVSGAVVAWTTAAGSVSPATSRTDANGAASAAWTLGSAPGLVEAAARVDEGTLTFTALAESDAPARIAIVEGDGATGGVGQPLADSLAVRVTDRLGNPVPNAAVAWSATGGGAVQPAGGTTDARGIARARWTLGPAVGEQTARAQVPGVPPAEFSATAGTEGVPLQLAKRGGDGQRGAVGALLADSLGVTLRLPDGRGVSGARVTWSATAGEVAPAEVRTDASGRAAAVWRLGTESGLAQATATVDDGRLVFTALAESEGPAEVQPVAGGGTGGVGQPLADSLAVRVTDRHGNPVAGVQVDWSVLAGGGFVHPAQGVTDAAGIVRAEWALGPRVGPVHSAQAAVAGLPPATFSATGSTAGVTLLLGKRGGDGQRGPAGNLLADSLGVILRLPDGRGVADAPVAWSTASGTLIPTETRTDGRGRTAVAWRLGDSLGLAQATATVDAGTLIFTALVEHGTPERVEIVAGNGLTGPVGGALADSLAVRVSSASGNIAGVPVDWTVLAGGGAIEPARGVTDAHGIARARWTLGPAVGAVHSVRAAVAGLPPLPFTATGVTAGVPLQLAKRGGDGQHGRVGMLLEDSLGVTLRLQDGRGVSGARVNYATASGAIAPAMATTDAQGRAAASWRLGSTPGLVQATATVDDGTLTFTAAAEAIPTVIAAVGSTTRTGGVGQPVADSLAVRLTDAAGNPLEGIQVTWGTPAGHGSVSSARSTTNAQGIARTRWTLGLVVDSVQRAFGSVDGLLPVTFTGTAGTQGVTLELVRRAGDGQTAPGGSVLPAPLVAEVRTPAGEPVRNALVGWAVTSGGGVVRPTSSRTDAQGRARTEWRLGTALGAATATATLDGGTISFSATQTATTRTITLPENGWSQTVGTMVEFRVRVTDAAGAPVSGVEVRFEVLAGGGFIPFDGEITSTGADGFAVGQWVLGIEPGANRLAVRATGAPEVEATATGEDNPLFLVLEYPREEVELRFDGIHTSLGAWTQVEVRVIDQEYNTIWGMPVVFSPNKGEAGATVLTGSGPGGSIGSALFFWEGLMGEQYEDYLTPILTISAPGIAEGLTVTGVIPWWWEEPPDWDRSDARQPPSPRQPPAAPRTRAP